MCLKDWISMPEQYSTIISSAAIRKIYLADLELLQYDIMYGDQYVYAEEGSPMKEGHMYMGVKDAVISQVTEQYNKTYSIYGENFTKQSKVFINGEKQKTTFLNNTRLDLKESKLFRRRHDHGSAGRIEQYDVSDDEDV